MRLPKALAAFVLIAVCAFAQRFSVQNYSVDNGLSTQRVNAILQDRERNIWAATVFGISRYNGYEWKNYDSTAGLPAQQYKYICEDGNGTLWACGGNTSERIVFRNGETWEQTVAISGAAGTIGAFAVLQTDAGIKQFLAVDSGLLIRSKNGFRLMTVKDGLPGNKISALEAVNGRLFICTEKGLAVYENGRIDNSLRTAHTQLREEIFAMTQAGNSYYFLQSGCVRRLSGNTITTVVSFPPSRVMAEAGSSFIAARPPLIIIGGLNRKTMYDERRGAWYDLSQLNGFSSEGSRDAFVDTEGNIWFCDLRGIDKIGKPYFLHFQRGQGLLEREVTAIAELSPGVIVFGHNYGITVSNGKSFRAIKFVQDDTVAGPGRRVLSMLASKGSVYIAASKLGMYRLDRELRCEHLPGINGTAFALAESPGGDIWAAIGKSVGTITADGKAFSPVANVTGTPRKLFFLNNRLYVCTTNGLVEIDTRTGRTKSIVAGGTAPFNLYSAHQMNDSTMLIGAEAGLYELTNGNYIPYKISGGTIHAAVYSILQANGYIYVGTNDGVFYFNRSGELFQHGRGGTLVGTEINRSALIEDSYGRIWIGTERGATCYDREYDNVTALPPRVVLTGVEGADGLLHSMSEDVSFPRSSNALRFHFYAPSFIQENLLEYEYKLTGIDTAFRTATQARLDEIRYVHLPSGKYFFEARARNKNGVWGPVARSAEIHISAPFYLSVWFMALVLIVAGGGYYVWRKYHAGVRYRLQLEAAVTDRTKALRDSHEELMKLNRELEARVAERTKELEKLNRSKDRFFSIIAHDLKSPFQGLLGFSDLLLNEYYSHNDSERLEFLARLHQLSQKSYALLENLLQWSRLQTNRIKPDPGYFKIHDIVENVNDLLLAQASVKNISLVNNTDPSAAAFGDLTMTSQAIQNLVSNAIKFSHSDSSVVIESGADDSRWTEVLVVDKGVGIKPEDGEKLFRIEVQHSSTGTNNEKGTGIGLLIAKDLVELNKGAISFTSIPGEGTTFRIKLPRQQP